MVWARRRRRSASKNHRAARATHQSCCTPYSYYLRSNLMEKQVSVIVSWSNYACKRARRRFSARATASLRAHILQNARQASRRAPIPHKHCRLHAKKYKSMKQTTFQRTHCLRDELVLCWPRQQTTSTSVCLYCTCKCRRKRKPKQTSGYSRLLEDSHDDEVPQMSGVNK